MPKFNVSCDLLVPVLLEIEADNADDAAEKLYEMQKTELLKLANTEEHSMGIVEESVDVDMETPQ